MNQMVLCFGADQVPKTMRNKSADVIRSVLLDVLPPNVPPSFLRVIAARFVGKSRVIATLEMFDGRPAEVEAWQWRPDAWAHRWNALEGGDISWEDGAWRRIIETIDA